LRATVKLFTGSLLCGLVTSAVLVQDTAAHPFATAIATGQLVISQASPTQANLLNDARNAMKNGKFELAEQLINQARKTAPRPGPQKDTPDRVFNALTLLRGPAAREAASPPATPLLAARRALANGQVDKTLALIAEAKRKGIREDVNGDNRAELEKLVDDIRRHNVDKSITGSDRKRRNADLLMQQAEGLMLHGDLDMAEKLLDYAATFGVPYGAIQRSPQRMLDTISQRRSGIPTSATSDEINSRIAETRQLLSRARIEMDRGNLDLAKRLAYQANQMRVQLPAGETQAWKLVLEIADRERRVQGTSARYPVAQATGYTGQQPNMVRQSMYTPSNDETRVRAAQATQPTPAPVLASPPVSKGVELFQDGLTALQNRDNDRAIELFRQAWQFESELEDNTRRQLRDKLNLLTNQRLSGSGQGSVLEEVTAQEQIAKQQLFQEITNEQKNSDRQKVTDPIGALNRLESVRGRVLQAEIDDRTKQQFLRIVDADINRMKSHIDANRGEIELTEQNRAVLDGMDRDRQALIESQDKLAELVQQFNVLMDERQFHSAEIIAKKAFLIAPDEPTAQLLVWKAKFAIRDQANREISELKESRVVDTLLDIDRSSTQMDPNRPYTFPDSWADLTNTRRRYLKRQNQRFSPEEVEIQQSLKSKVDVHFQNVPLDEVLRTLADSAGVPVFIDPQGLAAEAVTNDEAVTIELSKAVSLRAALNLILQPLRLSYVVEDQVLKITSETARRSNTYFDTYNVADLVIPIPNFGPSNSYGLTGALREAHANLGYGVAQTSGLPLAMASSAANSGSPSSVLAQTNAFNMLPNASSLRSRPPQSFTGGPGGMGGAALADFDTLINLITNTVMPDSWEENGGNGAIEPYPANLSLVISTTQEVHEEIADLLEQLREWQDLQVTIEVRFITLNDNFFERIGIDFDVHLDDNTGLDLETPFLPDDDGPSLMFGLDPLGQPTADLDLQFLQEGFSSAVPTFGGFDAATVSSFGFAILSDIEVFFLMQAATGDRRTNVLAAPRVTLFNGQQANVSDLSTRPFVTSIIPVVGDFAAAQQPVITVLGEGTSLNVQAVVSHDRRFVRLTLVPFFSQIGNVDTFTFEGTTVTNNGTNLVDANGDPVAGNNNNIASTISGTTVQLPTFSFTTVTTTVNVPDGGTVLLGGIKRLSEGRNERGVPMLSKLPYISRLFKNVGIGRDTQSLMMMVTPRIIIQREEEERLVGDISE